MGTTAGVRAGWTGLWSGYRGPWRDDSGGLKGLRFYLSRLRLPRGPAQDLSLRLEGAIALPREPELEFNAWVGLLQEDLQEQILGGGPGGAQRLLRPCGAGVDHAGARCLVGPGRADRPVPVEHVAPVAPHQRCKGRVSPGSLEMALPISPTLPSPSPGDSGGQRGASSLGPCDTQVVPAPVGGADVSGALGDQGHVPVPSEGTWAGGKEGVGEQLGCI